MFVISRVAASPSAPKSMVCSDVPKAATAPGAAVVEGPDGAVVAGEAGGIVVVVDDVVVLAAPGSGALVGAKTGGSIQRLSKR